MRGLIARTASGLLALGALANAAAASAEERLAVAGGCATEIVFALGAGERIVGVDTTSNWPPEARDLPRFGYLRTLPVEGILALKPDRLLTTAEAGPPSSIERLSKAMPVDVLPVMRADTQHRYPATQDDRKIAMTFWNVLTNDYHRRWQVQKDIRNPPYNCCNF